MAGAPALLKAVGIGSCVVVALYDRNSRVGSLVHVVLPYVQESHNESNPGRFADVGIGMMVEKMKVAGSRIRDMEAKIFGGGNMFPETISSGSDMDIGKRNVLAVRQELERFNIGIAVEDVGGDVGRTVLLDTRDGSVIAKNACLESKTF